MMMDRKQEECCSPEMMQALSDFGKLLSIASIYGMSHPSVARPLTEAHRTLTEALEKDEMVMLGLFNKTLTINDKMVTSYTVHLRALERRFIALDVPHLLFRKGLSEEELSQLVDALCASGPATTGTTVKERLDAANLTHIKADHVQYVAQHEGQRLVGEEAAAGTGDGASAGVGGRGAAGEDDGGQKSDGDGRKEEASKAKDEKKEKAEPVIKVEQIVAFLKGAPGAADTMGDDLQELVADPEKLGELILQSADVRQTASSLDDGESLADIVIGCLRKTYDGLAQQRKYKSTTGKASLHKAMLLLEQTVVDKIRNAVGEEQPELDEQILEALREAEEQRQVEILAARFVEQQKKITKVEMDILRYVREYGEEKARQMLSSSEIPDEEWNRMMIQNRRAEAGGGTGGDSIDMGALAIVLDKLEDIMELDNVPPEIVKSAIGDLREGIQDVSSQVGNKIGKIEEEIVRHEEACRRSPGSPENRKKRGDILLEISQLTLKLAQPLTVISASIDGAMDPGNSGFQKDLLEMAQEAAETMKKLMDRLTALVGFPSMQEADQNILLYD